MATFTIFVKMLTGKVIETHVSPSDTVRKLKEKIHDKAGLKPEEQRYIFAGKQLHDEQKLSECGLTKECIINLVPRIAGPAPAESSAASAPAPVQSSAAAPRDAKSAEFKAEAKAQQHSKADEERAPQEKARGGMQKMQTKEGAEEAERRARKAEKEGAEEAERRARAQAKAEKEAREEAERRAAEKTKEGAARRDAPATTLHVHTHTHTQTHTHTPAPTPSPTAAAAPSSSLPAMEVREVNDEQRRLLSRLVRLCESFNDSFDWPTYKEIKAIRATLVEQKVLDRSENE